VACGVTKYSTAQLAQPVRVHERPQAVSGASHAVGTAPIVP